MSQAKDTILRVEDLKISFRTVSGKVQAVRNVSFNLEKGETLAIVGESGSGKSVTTRAAMGILAKNAIVESGQILYDGKDMLKLSEWELHKIRGEKISMIFQDPLSSLNPIVRIGRQLTEAPVLKAKSKRKENKISCKETLKVIRNNILESVSSEEEKKNQLSLLSQYEVAIKKAVSKELPYTYAYDFLKTDKDDIEEALFAIEHQLDTDQSLLFKEILALTKKSFNEDLFVKDKEISNILLSIEKKLYPLLLKRKFKKGKKEDFFVFEDELRLLKGKVETALAKEKPDFLGLALLEKAEGNEKASETRENFESKFLSFLADSITISNAKSQKSTAEALSFLKENHVIFEKETLDKKELISFLKKSVPLVENTINPLSLNKDSFSFTYGLSLKKAILSYWKTLANNEKEEARYKKEMKKWNALKAKGKEPSFKVAPANVIEEKTLRKNITKIIDNLIDIYSKRENDTSLQDSKEILSYLNGLALGSKKKHTAFMAKIVAIRLMKEVGIPEPRKRFHQYPFEFSGGMRQRIVIAIALTGDPEVLICDEPTTALDVTIQAQILELINRIKKERKLSVIFITHNLGVVANMADKIAVMYAGQIVEFGTYNDIFYDAKHPYTWALLSSMPDLETKEKLDAIPGTPPNMIYPPKGDAFADRNKYALKIDFRKEPPMFMVGPTHFAKTWLLEKEAPTVIPPEIVLKRIARMEEKYGKEIDEEMKEELLQEPDEAFVKDARPVSKEKAKRLDPVVLLKKGGNEK